jgi:hypothetical protein
MFAAELSELVGRPIATVFTAHNVSRLYAYIKLELYIAGLPAGAAGDLAATTPTSGAEQSSARSSRSHSPDVEPAPRSDL